MNLATQPIRPALYFYDQEGNPIAAESVVDVMGDLEVTEDGSLTVQTEMEPLGELTISTHGQGEVVSGSVKVVSNGPIGGVLRFDLPGGGVAGVGASQPVRDALFPARREGDLSTAGAIRNLGEEAMEGAGKKHPGSTRRADYTGSVPSVVVLLRRQLIRNVRWTIMTIRHVLWDFGDTLVDQDWMLRPPEAYPNWPQAWVEPESPVPSLLDSNVPACWRGYPIPERSGSGSHSDRPTAPPLLV